MSLVLFAATRSGKVRTLASILSKYSGSHLWDFGVSADKVAAGAGMTAAQFLAAYPNHNLFQESTGVTPAYLPTHPVGLCLDQGTGSVVLGAEKVVNGTNLVSTTGWTASDLGGSTPATLSVSGGSLVVANTGTSYGAAVQAIPVTSGSTYVFTAVFSKGTAASINIRIGAASFGYEHLDTSTTGTATPVRVIFKAASASINVSLLNATTTDGTGIYAQISLKEVIVAHASQSTTTKRSVLTGTPLRSVFDGVDDFIRTTTGGGSSTAFSLVMGFNTTATGAAQTLWSDRTGNTGLKLEITAANAIAFSGGNGAAIVTATGDAVAANTSYVVTAKYDGATLSVRLNGGSWATATCALSAGTAAISIGCNNEAATGYYKGALQQAVYIKDTLLTDSEMQVAERAVNTAIGGAF